MKSYLRARFVSAALVLFVIASIGCKCEKDSPRIEPLSEEEAIDLSGYVERLAQAIEAGDAELTAGLIEHIGTQYGQLESESLNTLSDAVFSAARRGDTGLFAAIVEFPPLLKIEDAYGRQPLHLAAETGQVELIRQLVESGAVDINRANPRNGWTALHYLSAKGDQQQLAEFLNLEPNLLALTKRGESALHLAVLESNRPTTASLLGSAGSSQLVAMADGSGRTPLHIAADRGQPPMVELLLAHGANRNAKDNRGRTPLDLAEERGHEDVVARLGGEE